MVNVTYRWCMALMLLYCLTKKLSGFLQLHHFSVPPLPASLRHWWHNTGMNEWMNEWMCYYSIHNKQLISLIFQLLKPAHFTRTFQVFIVSDSTKLNTDENYICVPFSVTFSLLFTVASHISVFPNISKSHTACFTVWPQTSFQVHICVFSFFFFF